MTQTSYLCQHHADGVEPLVHENDPFLPDYVVLLECPECGQMVEWDTDLDEPVRNRI